MHLGRSFRRIPCAGTCLLFAALLGSAALPAEKPDVWIEVTSPHFHILCNDGEKTARRIAEQFEQIRVLYSRVFSPGMRIDPGSPIEIIAVKNEKALSQIVPEYWAEKGHMHPSGLFLPGPEKTYIALRDNVEGDFPYIALYHEYVHLIENLNFQHLPLWLDEGYATFFGSATLFQKSGRLGQANKAELDVLKERELLPLDVLFRAGRNSPYYNEADKTNIFYAESWALVHYLMLSESRQKGAQLGRYIGLVETGGDAVESAAAAFGDLRELERELDLYVSHPAYAMLAVELPDAVDPGTYPARVISPAEVDATLGAFDVTRLQLDSGRAKIEEALKLDPNLAVAQECMGFLLFREHKREEAEKYFSRAVALDSRNALTYYYDGALLLSTLSIDDDTNKAQAALEKAVALKPELAPAWDALAGIYVNDPDTLDKALNAARQAVRLVPGEARYRYNLAVVLLEREEFQEARSVARGITDSADASLAAQAKVLVEKIQRAQAIKARKENIPDEPLQLQAGGTAGHLATAGSNGSEPALKRRAGESAVATTNPIDESSLAVAHADDTLSGGKPQPTYSMVGTITAVACGDPPQMTLTLRSGRVSMRLHAANAAKVAVKGDTASAAARRRACSDFADSQARISYRLNSQKQWDGEIVSIELLDAP